MHSRRNALLVVSTGMIGSTLLPRAAKAQAEDPRRQASRNFSAAVSFSEQYLNMVVLAEHESMLFEAQERARQALDLISRSLPQEQPDLLARVEYLELVDAVRDHGQSLNPIEHFGDPNIERVFENRPEQVERGNITEVLRDIILEVLGIVPSARSVVNGVFEEHGVNRMISEFMEFYEDGERWQQTRHMVRILRLIFSAAVIRDLESALGARAFARVLGRLAARAVPFLGWPLLAGDVLAAIYRHRERLGLVRP